VAKASSGEPAVIVASTPWSVRSHAIPVAFSNGFVYPLMLPVSAKVALHAPPADADASTGVPPPWAPPAACSAWTA